jgi:tetratricopeptide (TPR) repeat protein
VDGHPLVREHFGAALEKSSPDVWKQAHSRLFDYFCTIPDKDQPDGEAGLLPLYQSLHHGVAAGRAQEALFHIYYQRIDRNGRGYGTHQLSLFSTELAAFAAFFPGGWQTPVQEVSREAQGYLLNLAGFGLRALGRLKEAQTPFERNIALNIELEDYLHAAADSDNLSELLFERGELQAALKRSNDTVELIDRTTEKHEQSAYRAQTAHVLAILGKVEEAGALFEEAEQQQN